MSDYSIRPITEAEYPDFTRCVERAFGHDHDETEAKLERETLELERTLAAFDERDGIVATAVAQTRELGVPGGSLPCAHVTGVAVFATHRRRGLLTRLMRRQLGELRAAGTEPIAALWPSEEAIYGRYGYGPAAPAFSFDGDIRGLSVAPHPDAGRLRELNFADSADLVSAVYDAARATRPGWSSRSPALWRMWQADLPAWRGGASGFRLVAHEPAGGGAPDGYAVFRIGRGSDADGRLFTVRVEDFCAASRPAYAELWRYLLSIDLTRRLSYEYAAADEPLRHLVADYPRLNPHNRRNLWVRVVDVPAALAARRYTAPVDVTLKVTDALLPDNAGRWRLTGGPDGARCEPAAGDADLSLDVAELGAAYLGGTTLSALAAAGRVRELRPGALAATSTAFGWHRAPVGSELF